MLREYLRILLALEKDPPELGWRARLLSGGVNGPRAGGVVARAPMDLRPR